MIPKKKTMKRNCSTTHKNNQMQNKSKKNKKGTSKTSTYRFRVEFNRWTNGSFAGEKLP